MVSLPNEISGRNAPKLAALDISKHFRKALTWFYTICFANVSVYDYNSFNLIQMGLFGAAQGWGD